MEDLGGFWRIWRILEDSVGFLMILEDLVGFGMVLGDFGRFLRILEIFEVWALRIWRLIFAISGLSSPNGSQEASGGSF